MDQVPTDLHRTLALLRALPEDKQHLATDFIEDLARPAATYILSAEERAICEAALAGPLASAADVDDLLNKPW
jgi:hypothetical protein